jgi:hypothetical protein
MPHYFFRDVADQQPPDPGPSMRGKDNQIDAMTFRSVENLFKGISGQDQITDPWEGARPRGGRIV